MLVTSLDVGPGETFPVRIDLRLLRPLQAGSNAPVLVGFDGGYLFRRFGILRSR